MTDSDGPVPGGAGQKRRHVATSDFVEGVARLVAKNTVHSL